MDLDAMILVFECLASSLPFQSSLVLLEEGIWYDQRVLLAELS